MCSQFTPLDYIKSTRYHFCQETIKNFQYKVNPAKKKSNWKNNMQSQINKIILKKWILTIIPACAHR